MPSRTEKPASRKVEPAASQQDWARILEQLKTPLTFFGLALLVLMVTMGAVVTMARDMNGWQFAALCLMAFVFLAVVGIVAFLTVRWPGNLYDKVERAQQTAENVESFLEKKAFRDVVTGIVREVVTPEALKAPSERKDSIALPASHTKEAGREGTEHETERPEP